ncbi:MAG: CYTH domain-containing protein [Bacteroidia bacterium]|nr:CYTH domain-containing protein [Bacteroidia bacterium]
MWERVEKPECRELIQGYLCRDDQKVIRVRIVSTKAGKKGYLTIKGKMKNLGRPEFEYEIPPEEAQDLLTLTLFNLIEKTRYKYLYKGKIWDVDIFHGTNEGLCMAEIELEDPDEPIDFPEWVGEEVSHDPRYYNSYLSQHPFTAWKNDTSPGPSP